jgi:NAD(P)-dependent dehydrogenase (short-subunit alcohol dehydrogenase family)
VLDSRQWTGNENIAWRLSIMLLSGKVALITGAASGIGRATACLFAREGAKVVAADISETEGRATVERIHKDSGEAVFVKTDLGRKDEVESLIRTCTDRYGRVDILHSNAASYAVGSATEISEGDWDRTLDICLKATWRLARGIVPSMLSHGGGVIVITGSVHAIRGYRGHTAYQAAKGGLLALTRSLAADFAPTIRVNTILPGAVVTGLWSGISEQEREKIAQMCPLQRNGQPEDIAQVALFLASDMSSYMTGTCLVVDGGLSSVIQPQWE